MVYFISEAKIKEMCNDNISSEIIKTGIINVQTIQLKEIIGDSLAKTLETLITNNVVVEPYKTLLDSYIQPYMQYAVLAEIVVPATYKIGNIGLNQPYTDNVNSTTKSECVYVKQYYTERAAFMENRLTTYLEANRAVFTDYQNYKDITVAKSTTTQAGLFLGGKTRGNSVDNTTPTFIHDNTIRAYIRYDEAQNLTPDQQKLAQKNIGLDFEDGDINIDIDLDNYYTKEQVDTKLIPYITDNEVNLRLQNYYTKDTVNNLLDNLPIPEATSELVKDDVYTKSEVYNKSEVDIKIANISSGGSVDLSNYYTKQETYSKEEVNSLVANSGGGSSDTPTNTRTSMTIGDNYIVDLDTAYFTDIEVVAQKAKANPNNFVGQLITYKGKETERCKINSDNDNVVFSHDNITIDGSGDKSFDVELVQGTRIFDITQEKYPDIPNNEIWYKTIDGLPFEKIYVNAESRGTPFSHQYYDTELGLYRAVWSEAMEHVPECFVLRDGYSGEELENTQVTHVYLNNYSEEIFNVFNNCVALVEVQLGTRTTSLNQTFRNCRSLREIFIPSNITDDYNESFKNCINLNTIILGGNYSIYGIPQNVGFNYKDLGVNRIYCTTSNGYIEEFAETNGFTIIPYSGTEVNIVDYQPIYTEKNNIIINQGGGGGGTTDLSNYYTKQEVDELIDNVDTSDVDLSDYYTKNEVDTLIAEIPTFSGNYNDLINKPSVDIMSLPYSEQYNVLQYLVDNNVLPYTVTYNGVVLNNLPVEIDWWDEEQNQRQIIFSVYGVQSYNVRFITYEWYEGVIYNDTHAKEETDNLVKKGEVDERINNLNIPTLPTLATVATSGDYNDLENKPTLFDGDYNSLTNTPTIPTATSDLTLDNVYNKSEIDLQIAEINTTLGNINNILNTI